MIDEDVDEALDQATVAAPEPDSDELDGATEQTQVLSAAQDDALQFADTQVLGSVSVPPNSSPEPTGSPAKAPAEPAASQSQTIEIQPVNDGAEVLKSDSDAEILEIYLEEAEEEATNIVRLQKDWLLHPEDENALRNIRRAFHTIKGSGRLVGAIKIGEFAWDYEQLLNRIIDKTVPPERPVISAVGKAGQALTELVHELKTFEEPKSDIAYLRGLARALAEFKTEELLIDHTQTMAIIESPHDHITDDDEDIAEVPDAGFGVTTQMIEAEVGETEPQSWVDADKAASDIEVVKTIQDEAHETQQIPEAESDISKYDDTVLTEAPPIPSMDDRRRVEAEVRAKIAAVARARAAASYQRATDYSRVPEAAADDDASAINADVFDEPEVADGPAIEIESMGDDFVGENMIFDAHDDLSEQASLAASVTPEGQGPESAELEIESLPPLSDILKTDQSGEVRGERLSAVDAEEPVSQMKADPSAMEVEAGTFDEEDEADVIEITGLIDEPADEDQQMQALESGHEAEVLDGDVESDEIEITGLTEQAGDEDQQMQALESGHEAEVFDGDVESDEIEITGLTEQAGDEDQQMQAFAEGHQAEVFDEGIESDEIEITGLTEQSGDEEIEMMAIADESAVEELETQAVPEQDEATDIEFEALDDALDEESAATATAADERHEPSDFAAPPDREDPTGPFVGTTTSPMPGAGAEGSEPRAQGLLEPTGLSFDPELLTIYQQEVEQHLDTVSSALDQAEKIRELIPGEDIYRALHTIHGASRTADISTIGELAALLEKPLKTAIAQSMALDHEIVALYREGQRALKEMTAELVATRQMPEIPRDLQISLQALADDFEEYTVDLTRGREWSIRRSSSIP